MSRPPPILPYSHTPIPAKLRLGIVAAAVLAVAIGVLAGPAATWLHGNELRPSDGLVPDVVYLLAGEREQNRRSEALADYVTRARTGAPDGHGVILAGCNRDWGRWSSTDGRNLTICEWAVKGLHERLEGQSASEWRIGIIPGKFRGTDGELRSLAAYIESNSWIHKVVLVTSPFHVRRTVRRFKTHVPASVEVCAIAAKSRFIDRSPWTVTVELVKIARDSLGLANTPFLTRRGWPQGMRPIDGVIGVLVLVLGYAWAIYPFLLLASAGFAVHFRKTRPTALPSPRNVAILLSAHNEEDVIARRMENLLESSSASSSCTQVRIHVGVDGSSDRTAAIVREYAVKHERITLHEFAARRGKVAVLKDLVKAAKGQAAEILVFTDANALFEPGAMEALLRHFEDRSTGAVCGRLELVGKRGAGAPVSNTDTPILPYSHPSSLPEATYWQWETILKTAESVLDSCLGANGAIYAVRVELFWDDIPDNTIVDDFVIGMKVRESLHRIAYDPSAVASEDLPDTSAEWNRRVRIGAGDYQALALCRRCLSPKFGAFAWMFMSHKVLRWFTPHLGLLAVLISAFDLLVHPPSWILLRPSVYVLGGFLLVLLFAELERVAGRKEGIFRHFVTMQFALLTGFVKYLRGNLSGAWERTPRERMRAET